MERSGAMETPPRNFIVGKTRQEPELPGFAAGSSAVQNAFDRPRLDATQRSN
jgi:hypothetical protein